MEYYIIIAASLIIILSYLFNVVSSKWNIPSVLLLIVLGILFRELIGVIGVEKNTILDVFSQIKILEVLGTLGLILIVLEAALELKLEQGKLPLIMRSFVIALLGLLVGIFGIGGIFFYAFEMEWMIALLYATPLSILSSAIVIPSVANLNEHDEEFHIYESTFSDILGIMAFYFIIQFAAPVNKVLVLGDFSVNLIITIATSILLSYLLIYIFQNLETKVKLFLMIAVLFLLFSVGKLMHLSSLLVILIFGLVLNNHKLFFTGRLRKYVKPIAIENIYETFLMITIESAFVIRTFFFVIFGFSISLTTLIDVNVAMVSVGVLLLIYVSRYLIFFPFKQENIKRAVSIAPRGLITLLLFYSIPAELQSTQFKSGILLFVIIITSIIMTSGLMSAKEVEPSNDVEQ